MRINLRYGAAVGIAAAAFTTLGPATAQASGTPGTVMSAAASRYPGIGLGQDKLGLPAHQGIALQGRHRCNWDDRWCHHFRHRDHDDYGRYRYRHRDYDDYGRYHHRDYDDYGRDHHRDYDRFR